MIDLWTQDHIFRKITFLAVLAYENYHIYIIVLKGPEAIKQNQRNRKNENPNSRSTKIQKAKCRKWKDNPKK